MKKLFLPALLLLASGAQAQTEAWSSATIETNDSTLTGFVRNSTDEQTPQSFAFATTREGVTRQLAVSGIRKVTLGDGTTYERRLIRVPELSVAPLERRRVDYTPEIYFAGAALVEKVVAGPVNLYRFDDRYVHPHFFVTEGADTALTLLPYEPFIATDGSLQGHDGYRNLLSAIITRNGCPDVLAKRAGTVAYESVALTRLVQQISSCGGAAAQVTGRMNQRGSNIRFGFRVSGMYSTGTANLDRGDKRSMSGANFSVGGYIDFYPRRQNAASVASIGLLVGTGNLDEEYTFANAGYFGTARDEYRLAARQAVLDVAWRRLFGTANTRFFAEGGGLARLRFGQTIKRTVTDGSGNSANAMYTAGYSAMNVEPLVGLGVQSKVGAVHLRYSRWFRERLSQFALVLRVSLRR